MSINLTYLFIIIYIIGYGLMLYFTGKSTNKFFESQPKLKRVIAFEFLWLILAAVIVFVTILVPLLLLDQIYDGGDFLLVLIIGVAISYLIQGVIWSVGVIKKRF